MGNKNYTINYPEELWENFCELCFTNNRMANSKIKMKLDEFNLPYKNIFELENKYSNYELLNEMYIRNNKKISDILHYILKLQWSDELEIKSLLKNLILDNNYPLFKFILENHNIKKNNQFYINKKLFKYSILKNNYTISIYLKNKFPHNFSDNFKMNLFIKYCYKYKLTKNRDNKILLLLQF